MPHLLNRPSPLADTRTGSNGPAPADRGPSASTVPGPATPASRDPRPIAGDRPGARTDGSYRAMIDRASGEPDHRHASWRHLAGEKVPGPGEAARVEVQPAKWRGRRGWRLSAVQWLPRKVGELFPFFADAGNLERITPETVRFQIASPLPIDMRAGAVIEYRLRIRGVPVGWRTLISAWEPDGKLCARFVDEQLRGPYVWWVHEHRFEPMTRDGVDGCRCDDTVHYGVPGGPLAVVANALLVQRDVRAIFEHRARVMNELFGR